MNQSRLMPSNQTNSAGSVGSAKRSKIRTPQPTKTMARAEVAQFVKAIFEPRDLVEVRAILGRSEAPKQIWHRAANLPDQVEHLSNLNGNGFNMYIGANPRRCHGGRAKHVALARCLFVDFDEGINLD